MGGSMGGPSSDDKTWGMLSHLSWFLCAPISCIVILVTKGKESARVRTQTVEALNWQINILIAVIGGYIIGIIMAAIIGVLGLLVFLAVWIVGILGLVFAIMGAVKAYSGEQYKYPWSLKLIK